MSVPYPARPARSATERGELLAAFREERGSALAALRDEIAGTGCDPDALLAGTDHALTDLYGWLRDEVAARPDGEWQGEVRPFGGQGVPTWLRGPATCRLDRRSIALVDGIVSHVGELLSGQVPDADWRIGPRVDPARDGAIEFGVDADALDVAAVVAAASRVLPSPYRRRPDPPTVLRDVVRDATARVRRALAAGAGAAGPDATDRDDVVLIVEEGELPGEFELHADDVLAHATGGMLDGIVAALAADSAVSSAVRAERERVEVVAPTWSADTLRRWLTERGWPRG